MIACPSGAPDVSANSPAVYFLLSPFLQYDHGMPFVFEKLKVYQKAVTFADDVCTLTKGFPRG